MCIVSQISSEQQQVGGMRRVNTGGVSTPPPAAAHGRRGGLTSCDLGCPDTDLDKWPPPTFPRDWRDTSASLAGFELRTDGLLWRLLSGSSSSRIPRKIRVKAEKNTLTINPIYSEIEKQTLFRNRETNVTRRRRTQTMNGKYDEFILRRRSARWPDQASFHTGCLLKGTQSLRAVWGERKERNKTLSGLKCDEKSSRGENRNQE